MDDAIIDFGGRLIEVQRGERKGILSDTKNHKRRWVDMTPQLAETLQDLKLTQQKRILKKGRPFPEWLFANDRGRIFVRSPFKNALKKCLEEQG
jgi:integrase